VPPWIYQQVSVVGPGLSLVRKESGHRGEESKGKLEPTGTSASFGHCL
jgi:hypothetical protein